MSKIMNFADGPQEVSVGMKVVHSNGQGGRHFRLSETEIEKVGNKLITLKNGTKWYLEDGRMQTEYTSGSIYSSKAAFEKAIAEGKVIDTVKTQLRSYGYGMTYEQAIKIAEILNLKLEF